MTTPGLYTVIIALLLSSSIGRAADTLDTWTLSESVPTGRLNAITYGNGQFVVIGQTDDGQAMIVTSADSVNWVPRLMILRAGGLSVQLSDLIFANGLFVGVGGLYGEHVLGGAIFTSADGVTWIQRLLSCCADTAVRSIAYGNGQFLAISEDQTMTSRDGVEWKSHDSGPGGKITYGDGQFVAVGYDGTIATSIDGISWMPRRSGTTITLNSVAYGNGQFVAVGGDAIPDGISYRNIILSSADGLNWVKQESGVTDRVLAAVTYGSGHFVATGSDGILLTSTDAVNWKQRQSSTSDWFSAVAHGGGRFVAVVSYGRTIAKSGVISSLSIVLSNETGWISLSLAGAIGLDYTIQSSPDMISWRDMTKIIGTQATETILVRLHAESGHAFYRAYSSQ